MGSVAITNYSITKNGTDNYSITIYMQGSNFSNETFVLTQDTHPYFNLGTVNSGNYTASNISWSFTINGFGSSCVLTFRTKASSSGSWQDSEIIITPDEYSDQRYPDFYPEVTHQWVWDRFNNVWYDTVGSCFGNTLATMKEIHEFREGKIQYNKFSVGWIYGNRYSYHDQNEGLYPAEALEKLMEDGVPHYSLLPENKGYAYPDCYHYINAVPTGINAKQLVQNNYSNVINEARKQRIKSFVKKNKQETNLYEVKNRIVQDGCVVINFSVTTSFDSVGSDGIVPEFFTGDFRGNHGMVILGWKKINNKSYWICQNSWGDWYGDNGLYYMPFYHNTGLEYYFVEDLISDILPWEWEYPKTSNENFNLTSNEWLNFCTKINQARSIKGLSPYSFTTSSTYIGKDKPFYAWIWLQAANAINDLGTGVASDCLNVKSQKVSMGNDSIIYPWYFENLKTALNNAISS